MKNRELRKGLIISAIVILVISILVVGYIIMLRNDNRGRARKYWENSSSSDVRYHNGEVTSVKNQYSTSIIGEGMELITDYIIVRTKDGLTFRYACTPHFSNGMRCDYVADDGFSSQTFAELLDHLGKTSIINK